ncbi:MULTISPECIES: cupin domain-containing protein [unclassified Tolypothrix]|uniref:cupin domain-containing protein n=1 Tax=unclassified Tolypothrix TaxID=2649714 RepID=UPI0005EABDF1|nr:MULTISPECIES: cupin domain-containing protein [unclassified Tolypothrix]BAY94240.1 cupin 2 domain-containing protein [Microchaete diplosiphon NIES-3275]EKF03915.1 putative cupin domain protein [Tolypothrix sp. PCC 7601]MBE9086769.1 cupin domain-containing protein [Tolypothrix sp. LEGE 11397]UYD27983.1 cupin domain-containing protein [Tolypothrix sp. PCC 7712]UYD36146.1 cupin domain-containing protein [Tolypothrix sp. PCC 7601]
MIAASLNDLPEESVSHNPEIKKKVMLRLGDLPHLTNFSQARFTPGQSASAHAHQDMSEVFFVEAGEGVIHVDGVEYPLLPGNCIAIEPGEVHEVVNTGKDELILTYFGLRVEKPAS